MNPALWSALAARGSVTNMWGKSGAGKTSLALGIAIAEIRDSGGKVLYITDDPASVAALLTVPGTPGGAKDEPCGRETDDFCLVRCPTFRSLGEVVRRIPFAFAPDEETRGSEEFKAFARARENDLNGDVVGSFKHYKPPTMVVVDEITRLYKRLAIGMADPGPPNLQLLAQLGFLRSVATERGIKVVVTSATRTIAQAIGGNGETRFLDVPVANDLLDRYADIDAQVQWTPRAGERRVVVTGPNGKGKQLQHVVDIDALHERLAGGIFL
ncbi:MAG: hypothetical protein JW839_15400 [Candidatus Lokiarchaeota archaeon]|nr:hypothetical protein [Candidatus Lokiarchaeota archaeon]